MFCGRAFWRRLATLTDLNATSSATPDSGSWRLGLLVFLAVLAFSAPQAALLPLLDRDEPRFAEASREMLQGGDIVVPKFNDEPRYNKPPLIYWGQAISFTLFGENAFAARFPSLLATAGTAVLLFAWGVSLGSSCIGMIAALGYAFCLQTIQQGRVGTADALLIFFMTLTAFAGWRVITFAPQLRDSTAGPGRAARSFGWGMILALGFAGGFLTKGPEALLIMLPLLVCARKSGGAVYIDLVCNFLLGLVLVMFWALPAYIDTNGEYWQKGLNEGLWSRMVEALQGHGASSFGWYVLSVPLYYPLLFWMSALPWSPLLVTHRKKLFSGWKPDPLDTYLLLNAGLIFVIFSLMVTKLPHYSLPAFPFLVLLFARRWIAADLSPKMPTQLAGGFGLVLAVLTAVLVPLALALHLSPSPTGELVREAQADGVLKSETEFAVVDFQEPNTIWEMRRVSTNYGQVIQASEVDAFLKQPGPRAVLLSSGLYKMISDEAATSVRVPTPATSWKIYQTSGWNTAKGWDSKRGGLALMDLTLVVKP